MNYPKLSQLHKGQITIESLYQPRWEKFDKATNKMEYKDEVTEADKKNGFKLKVGAVVNISNITEDAMVAIDKDGSGKFTINFSYSQIKNLTTMFKCKQEELIGKPFMVIWNNMEGLEARYSFLDV